MPTGQPCPPKSFEIYRRSQEKESFFSWYKDVDWPFRTLLILGLFVSLYKVIAWLRGKELPKWIPSARRRTRLCFSPIRFVLVSENLSLMIEELETSPNAAKASLRTAPWE